MSQQLILATLRHKPDKSINITNSKNKDSELLGRLGEAYAQNCYKMRGYQIINSNTYNRKGKRMGEIDFVALNGKEVVFVEVKTRREEQAKFGGIFESVDKHKQHRLLKTIKWLISKQSDWALLNKRIDVVGVCWPNLNARPVKVEIKQNAIEDNA